MVLSHSLAIERVTFRFALFLRGDMFEKGQARTLWNELKALWDPFVRFTIEMALVPFLEILASRPIRDQPNFVGVFFWAEHIESHKTGRRFN